MDGWHAVARNLVAPIPGVSDVHPGPLPALAGGAAMVTSWSASVDAVAGVGVASAMVRRIMVRQDADWIQIIMDSPGLSDGWWAAEGDGGGIWRWTNGDAVLPPLGRRPAMIEVVIGDAGPYPVGLLPQICLGDAA